MATRLDEKHDRFLKLLGGILTLALSIPMLINPALMNDLTGSLIILGLAIFSSLLVLFFQRVIFNKSST